MAEEFEILWDLLPSKDSNVYSELSTHLQQCRNDSTSSTTSSSSTTLSPIIIYKEHTVKFFEQSLYRYPYPTCQLLKFFPTIATDICYKIFSHLIRNLDDEDDGEKGKFYNLLTNIEWPDKLLLRFRKELLPVIVNHIEQGRLDCRIIWFALIAKTKQQTAIMELFLNHWKSEINFTNKSIFLQAVGNQKHFLDLMVFGQLSVPLEFDDCKNTILLAQTIFDNVVSNESFNNEDLSKLNESFAGSWNKLMFIELCRLSTVKRMLTEYVSDDDIQIDQLSCRYNVIDYLCQSIDMNTINFEKCLQPIIIENAKYNNQLKLIHPTKQSNDSTINELDLCQQFIVIKLLLQIIQLNNHSTENYESHLMTQISEVKKILQNIKSLPAYIQLLEIIFSLIFLRWEHICHNGTRIDDDDFDISPNSAASDENKVGGTKKSSTRYRRYEKYGFICNADVVDCILKTLKRSATHKKHSEELVVASDTIQQQFLRIYENITDAVWRLSLFRTIESGQQANFSKNLSSMICQHISDINKNVSGSSDDDNEIKLNKSDRVLLKKNSTSTASLMRRKPRRKQTLRKCDSDDKSKSFSQSTENERKSAGDETKVTFLGEKRCIVSRMLGSAEHLVTTCMSKGDISATKHILKANNLDGSRLAMELSFAENLQQVKQKLAKIFDKYTTEECISTTSNQSTIKMTASTISSSSSSGVGSTSTFESNVVDRIRKVAAIGFEASKITNIMSSFALANKIPQSLSNNELIIDRYVHQYPFLRTYNRSDNLLQATIVVDLVLSLASNYDICANIFNMISKTWSFHRTENDQHIMGYYRFYRNLLSCLHQYKLSAHETLSVKQLLCNECYPLHPEQLEIQLEKEKCFKNLLKINVSHKSNTELNSIDELQSYVKKIEILCENNVNFFKRILSFISNMQLLLQFKDTRLRMNLTNILSINIYQLIDEIIFDNSVSPFEIETIACNINTNLVHLLATIISPKIIIYSIDAEHYLNSDQKQLTELYESIEVLKKKSIEKLAIKNCVIKPKLNVKVINYIKKHCHLLAYLLNEIIEADDETITYKSMCLNNFKNLNEINEMTILYDGNKMMSALNYDRLDVDMFKDYLLNSLDFEYALNIIKNSKEINQKIHGHHMQTLQDVLIIKVLQSTKDTDNKCHLIDQINDINIKAKSLLENLLTIQSDNRAIQLIKSILLQNNSKDVINETLSKQLSEWLHNIRVYTEISKLENEHSTTWCSIMEISQTKPEVILKQLINAEKYNLTLQWLNIHPLLPCSATNRNSNFIEIFTAAIYKINNNSDHTKLFQLIEHSLPVDEIQKLYSSALSKVRAITILKYLLCYLMNQKTANKNYEKMYKNYEISIKIIEQLSYDEQNCLWNLIGMPLLIIEQYLMNTKFDTLTTILKAIRPLINAGKCDVCELINSQTIVSNSNSDPNFKTSALMTKAQDIKQPNIKHDSITIKIDCIDSLLRLYATKALDFRINELYSSTMLLYQSTDMVSLDSLCGTFVMPKEPIVRDSWTPDNEATHCMCCRRAVFTLLTRRHHCRQCGRVVCHACSTKRMTVPNLYADILVRVCNDCFKQTEALKAKLLRAKNDSPLRSQSPGNRLYSNDRQTDDTPEPEWRFTGNQKHDTMLRDEFCYEFAPSISLCLSILTHHTSSMDCANFLLDHCRKFEKLLRPLQPGHPNPEVDYALVTRMLNCLALAAKVRGGPPECDTIRDHAEIIRSVVKHGCEALLPMEPQTSAGFRKLRDSLVVAEKWPLALEVSLKCGFVTSGVMAAWGISCLKSGCFDTAREKLAHCMNRTLTDEQQFKIMKMISYDNSFNLAHLDDYPLIRRPTKSSQLLNEIIAILELTCRPTQPSVLAKAALIRNSNTSLATSTRSLRKKETIPLHEPALNILNTLSNLKDISQGIYAQDSGEMSSVDNHPITCRKKFTPNSRFYDESLYYLINFASHIDIIEFLVRHQQLHTALKYFLYQSIDNDTFVHTIYLPHLKCGQINVIIGIMLELDDTLLIWKQYIIQTCRYLEKKLMLNSLYHLQILLNDPVRASMTCIRWYSMGCKTFQNLLANSFHLVNAQGHLQTELELCQWEEIKVGTDIEIGLGASTSRGGGDGSGSGGSVKSSSTTTTTTTAASIRGGDDRSLLMKMDSRTLNGHINTIWRQIEVCKFLAKCEQDGRATVSLLPKICSNPGTQLPTLFGSTQEKIQLVILVLISGINIEEGFGLAFRIIQDFNLSTTKSFGSTAKYLAGNNRLQSIEKLIDCIRSNNGSDNASFCDEIILLSIQTAIASLTTSTHQSTTAIKSVPSELKTQMSTLIGLINDIGTKITCYILSDQLKTAYLRAVEHNRLSDIKRILRKADQTNQLRVKKLCEAKLKISSNTNNSDK